MLPQPARFWRTNCKAIFLPTRFSLDCAASEVFTAPWPQSQVYHPFTRVANSRRPRRLPCKNALLVVKRSVGQSLTRPEVAERLHIDSSLIDKRTLTPNLV